MPYGNAVSTIQQPFVGQADVDLGILDRGWSPQDHAEILLKLVQCPPDSSPYLSLDWIEICRGTFSMHPQCKCLTGRAAEEHPPGIPLAGIMLIELQKKDGLNVSEGSSVD
jgi:hypothetical protein